MATSAQEMVTQIDAAIVSIVAKKTSKIDIDGTAYEFHNLNDLRALRASYQTIAQQEAAQASGMLPFGRLNLSAGHAQ